MHRAGSATSSRNGVRVVAGLAAVVGVALALPACRNDGRTLRPAGPDQTASVSTVAPPTDPPLPPEDGVAGGFDFPATTVPLVTAAPVVPPTTATEQARLAPVLHAPWSRGADVQTRFTCDGEDVSPALSWTAAPAGTVEIAIALTDDDAPDFVHWAVAGISPDTVSVGEGELPVTAIEGTNSAGTSGYTGPCPPAGETHTYHYTVFFLGVPTRLADGVAGEELLAAIRANALDSATVSSTYQRA